MSALSEKERKTGLIGRKLGMTSLFDEMGKNVPCTVIELGPCYVTQIKIAERDGYEAIQIAYGNIKEKNVTKSLKGHYKKAGVSPKRKLMEIDYLPQKGFKIGDEITVNMFREGEFVDVIGISKGKGFQGVVKRHGFRGVGDATHGQHNRLRAPGSIGAGSDPSRVFKGIKMAGQTGNQKVTVQNLKVLKIDENKNVIVVCGAVPGHNNAYISVHK